MLVSTVQADSNVTTSPPAPAVRGGMKMTSQKEECVKIFKHAALRIKMHVVNYLTCLLSIAVILSPHCEWQPGRKWQTGRKVPNHSDRAFLRTCQMSPPSDP